MGRNGSGKSTLLKLVTGIYAPTSGTVEVHGRISALLELGAGFHPDFSGRENILVNGIILGMSRREIRARMDEIIDFSELGDFIDEPVRTYSSGMFARLAFAVATHVDPEILIIDEILSVGDEHFARKSAAKMEEFRRAEKTTLLVTHDLATLQRRCDAAAWLDGGVLRASGDPAQVVAAYRAAVAEAEMAAVEQHVARERAPVQPRSSPPAEPGRRWGSFAAELSEVEIRGGERPAARLLARGALRRAGEVHPLRGGGKPRLEVSIRTEGQTLLWSSSEELPARGRGQRSASSSPASGSAMATTWWTSRSPARARALRRPPRPAPLRGALGVEQRRARPGAPLVGGAGGRLASRRRPGGGGRARRVRWKASGAIRSKLRGSW